MTGEGAPLVCPGCAATHVTSERFCPDCGFPLVYAELEDGDQAVSPAHERARKVKKQYLDGELVSVAGARHLAEAELIQSMLLEEGVPSMLRRTRGFDVPDMMAAGPRDILVPTGGAEVARQILLQAELIDPTASARAAIDAPGRIVAGLVAALVIVGLILWCGVLLAG